MVRSPKETEMQMVEWTDAAWREQLTFTDGPQYPTIKSCALEQRSQGLQSS